MEEVGHWRSPSKPAPNAAHPRATRPTLLQLVQAKATLPQQCKLRWRLPGGRRSEEPEAKHRIADHQRREWQLTQGRIPRVSVEPCGNNMCHQDRKHMAPDNGG